MATKVNMTGEALASDQIDAHTCPVCGYDRLSYEPNGAGDMYYDSYDGAIYIGVSCLKCGSLLSASFDFHDVQVDLDARFGKED